MSPLAGILGSAFALAELESHLKATRRGLEVRLDGLALSWGDGDLPLYGRLRIGNGSANGPEKTTRRRARNRRG